MGTGIDPQKPILDHVVFNVRFEMDRAASLFETVGFQLTDRGYHTLGSINHLMMLTTDYLELIGLPSPNSKPTRADIAAAPYGLNGLVFKSADVHETYEHLKSIGMAGDPPKSFSRPVQLDDGEVDASFRTVTVRSDVFSAGRVYFCEHLTPEYVWRPEWQTHSNSASALRGFVLGAQDPMREAARFSRLLGLELVESDEAIAIELNGSELQFLSPSQLEARFGSLASIPADGALAFCALSITADTRYFDGLSAHGMKIAKTLNGHVVKVTEFDALMEFV